jgi:hypothetical protein
MKVKQVFVCVVLLLVVFISYSPAATVVAHYSFDDAANLNKDDSGNGHDLTLFTGYATPTYDAAGAIGGASRFNGSTQGWFVNNNMYPSGSFSLTTWIKDDGGSTMITQPWSLTSGFQAVIAGDFRFWTLYDGGSDYMRSFISPSGQWQHIAMTFEAAGAADASGTYTGTIKAYIDGNLANTLADAQYDAQSFNDLAIGRRSSAAFNGMIDEFTVYSGALTANEVAASAVPEPATVSLLVLGSLLTAARRKGRK